MASASCAPTNLFGLSLGFVPEGLCVVRFGRLYRDHVCPFTLKQIQSMKILLKAIAKHWFTDLPTGQEIHGFVRWLIATLGSIIFMGVYYLLAPQEVFDAPSEALTIIVFICLAISAILGFLLAWKRKNTGPVRLFISGITLPAFVLLVAHVATLYGGAT